MTKLYMLLSIGIALVLHLVFGWQYAVIGAIIAGALLKERPVLAGMITLISCWGGLVVYSFSVASEETMRMVVIMSAIIGDLPPFATVALTVGIAAILGATGGWLGAAVSPAINSKESN